MHIPIIPADTRNKKIWLNGWSTMDFTDYEFRSKLENGEYDNGIAVRLGKTLSSEFYSVALDFDGRDAVLEWFGSWEKVVETAKRTRIEWHKDKWRLHMFFLTKEPIANRKIQIKDSLLEVRCEGQALFVSPSIHLEGEPYQALGTHQISNLSNLFGLKSKINSLCEDYMSNGDQQAYIKWLEDPANYTKLGEGQGRHNGLVMLGTSYYYRYNGDWKNYTDDERRAKLWEWNNKLAVPKPEKEVEDIWKWIVSKHRKHRDEEHEQLREGEKRKREVKEFDKAYVFSMYHDTIKAALEENMWTEIHTDPPKWIIADLKRNLVYKAHEYNYEVFDENTKQEITCYGFSIDDNILKCIPLSIIKHESPIDFLNVQTTYTIKFKDTTGITFILARKTITQIMDYLKDDGYVLHGYSATEAFSAIVTAFREDDKIIVERSVDFEGFYYSDGDIQRSIGLMEQFPQRSKEECALAADCLNKLSEFYVYNIIDRRDVLATVIKWTITAPFNFALKQLVKKYMNALSFSGERDGGKTALSDTSLCIHGHFEDKSVTEQSIYDLSAGSMNTDAKFGNGVSHTTFPIALSEYGRVEAYGRDEKLVETVKNAIERLICRHGRREGKYDYPFLALSPIIINGNPPISKKGEILKRFHVFKYSQEDRHTKDDPRTIAYNNFMKQRRRELKILGDWTLNYIWDNRAELLLSKKYDAYQIMDVVIREFYDFARVEMPEWMTGWITETALEELDVDEAGIIRSILFDYIHEKLRMNAHLLAMKNDGVIDIETRISTCLDRNLLSFIREDKVENGVQVYHIDSSVLMLFEIRLPDLTLKRLGEKIGLEYKKTPNRMVLVCTRVQLWNFLL